MPIDKYDVLASRSDILTLEGARQTAIAECLSLSGYEHSGVLAAAVIPSIGDRPYGLWQIEQAQVSGFGDRSNPFADAIAADRSRYGEAYVDALDQCVAKLPTRIVELFPSPEELQRSPVEEIKSEAYRVASSSPDWQEARDRWLECLIASGLTPPEDPRSWISTEGAEIFTANDTGDSKEEISIASKEARCNVETGLSQTLGNLEAMLQASLIQERLSELTEWAEKKQERLSSAREYQLDH